MPPSFTFEKIATTISTRYLHMRRQFADPEASSAGGGGGGPREQQVIKYPSVYMRVIPQIVNAYVFISAGKEMVSFPLCSLSLS